MSSPKAQVEVLMNDLVDFAEKMLSSHGEFHPFGGYLSKGEEVVHVGVSSDMSWSNDQERADALVSSFRSMAQQKSPIALGIVTNVSFASDGGSSDAIRVFLEHVSGYCADVFFHYVRSGDGIVSITDVTAQQGTPHLFPDATAM